QEFKDGLITPRLEMEDAQGNWKVVDGDMGMPAGKPKTIAVPLHFISASRKVRIVTNLCVYWDESFLSEGESRAGTVERAVPLKSANLHYRGFSETRIHPQRKQPDTFDYNRLAVRTFWNPTAGVYTRYGDVRELLGEVDDRLVLMGSGDEIKMRFDAG